MSRRATRTGETDFRWWKTALTGLGVMALVLYGVILVIAHAGRFVERWVLDPN